jgi:hypothetical protein
MSSVSQMFKNLHKIETKFKQSARKIGLKEFYMEKTPNKTTGQKESFTHKVGDTIERVGRKISNAGAEKLGDAVYKAGDKIEHMRDKKRRP